MVVAIVYILAARSASPTEYGVVASAIALGMASVGFADFGSSSLYIRELASARMAASEYRQRALSKLLFAAAGAGGAVVFVGLVNPRWIYTPLVFLAGIVSLTVLVPLRAGRRGDLVAILMLSERVVAICLFGLLCLAGMSPLDSLVPSLVGGTIALCAFAYAATLKAERLRLRGFRFRNPWRGSVHYGLFAMAGSGQQLDLPLLTMFAGASAGGVFGSVNRWTQPMGLIASAFSSATAPFAANARNLREARHIATRASWLLVLGIGAPVLIVVAAPWLVPFLLGSAYAGAVPLLQLLAGGSIFAVLNQPLAAILQARRYDRAAAVIYCSGVVAQLGLIAGLASALGAIAAGVAYCVLQVGIFVAFMISFVIFSRREGGSAAR